ncbi:MAG TPA: HPP family protein [Actinomycetota bacterium]|nr:HPP family protein [Actinomycetota bacterium]
MPRTRRLRGVNRPRYGVHARVVQRFGVRGDALYVTIAVSLTMAVAGVAAWLLRRPLIFPSLGPSVFLCFESPMDPEASPRNTLVGHAVALLAGVAAVHAFRLTHTGEFGAAFSVSRGVAAGLSVGVTEGLLVLIRSPHPPAGATALIVALGLLAKPVDLLALMVGVVLVVAATWALNRALGIPVPMWAPLFPDEHPPDEHPPDEHPPDKRIPDERIQDGRPRG